MMGYECSLDNAATNPGGVLIALDFTHYTVLQLACMFTTPMYLFMQLLA